MTVATPHGNTPLHFAAAHGRLAVVQCLLAQGTPVAIVCNYGFTPLHWAASHGHLPVVQYLLAQGASAGAVSGHSDTPLHFAAAHGHLTVVQCLLAHGAPTVAVTDYGYTPLTLALAHHQQEVVALLSNPPEPDGTELPTLPVDGAATGNSTQIVVGYFQAANLSESSLSFNGDGGQTDFYRSILMVNAQPTPLAQLRSVSTETLLRGSHLSLPGGTTKGLDLLLSVPIRPDSKYSEEGNTPSSSGREGAGSSGGDSQDIPHCDFCNSTDRVKPVFGEYRITCMCFECRHVGDK